MPCLCKKRPPVRLLPGAEGAGVRVIAGGPLFTTEYEQFEEVDHFVLNEGELTMPRFLADLAQGNAERMYATAEFVDLQNSPTPLWELADRRRYASMSLQYSRGCPFHCEFCNVTTLFGHHSRVKSTAQVLTELDSLYDLGWRGSVFFVDDNFIGNKQHLKTDLLPALIAWRETRRA